jgi:cytochrome c556
MKKSAGAGLIPAAISGFFLSITGCTDGEAPANVDPAIVDAIKARQANFREMGAANKNIEDALKAAAQIKSFAEQQTYWFPPGSGPETGVETAAKAEIWKRPEDFRQRQQTLIEASSKLVELARNEERAAFVDQFRVVGRACKNCHDTFRTPEE